MFKSHYPEKYLYMEFFFLWVSGCCLTCAIFVIGVLNPIHSILLLIIVFFFGSILLFFLDLEFFALIFMIVYVGAIAVLFLFMVMTIDIKHSNVSENLKDFFSYKGVVVYLFLINLFVFFESDFYYVYYNFNEISIYLNENLDYSKILKFDNHLEVLGKALFIEYKVPFLLSGFILLISMIGAIVITVEDKKFSVLKQQDPVNQAYRSGDASIFNFKIYKKKYNKLY